MSKPVLVAYATKRGSTAEVAEAVAGALREHGLEVELRQAAQIDKLDAYGGVVLGGALYMGRWHSDARRFLARHRRALAELPVAFFGMGPLDLTAKSVDGSRKQLEHALESAPELEPLSVEIFGGVVEPSKLRFPFSHMQATDARDWDAIQAWSTELASKLGAREPVGAVS